MWQVLIHPLIFKEDFKKINPADQKLIIKSIRKKLALDPKAYGKALGGSLKGYWRLRVKDYRIVYSLVEDKVLVKVIKVGMRKDWEVYEEVLKRIPKTLNF